MSGPRIEPAAFIPWGTADAALAPDYQPVVSGGMRTSTRVRRRARPLLLRLDAGGGFHLWSAASGAIVSLTPAGAFGSRTVVADAARVVDYAASDDRFFVLLERPGAVRCIDRAGAEIWRREVAGNRLVLAGGSLYVADGVAARTLVELRTADGGVVPAHTLTQGMIRPFASGGALVSAIYLDAPPRRGVVVYDPAARKEATAIGGAELYGPLLSAVGADRDHHLYLYGTALDVPTPSLFEVGPDAKQLAREPMESVLAGDGAVYVVNAGADRFDVRVFAGGGAAPRTFAVPRPAGLQPTKGQRTQVVGVAGGRLLVDVLDGAGGLVARNALDLGNGALETIPGDTVEIDGAQPLDTWQVDADGAIYVPVTSSAGLTIVRVVL